jgi:hypothetical protein
MTPSGRSAAKRPNEDDPADISRREALRKLAKGAIAGTAFFVAFGSSLPTADADCLPPVPPGDAQCGQTVGGTYHQDGMCGNPIASGGTFPDDHCNSVAGTQGERDPDNACAALLSDASCGKKNTQGGLNEDGACGALAGGAMLLDGHCAQITAGEYDPDSVCGKPAATGGTAADTHCNSATGTGFVDSDNNCGNGTPATTDASCHTMQSSSEQHSDSHCGTGPASDPAPDSRCGDGFADGSVDGDAVCSTSPAAGSVANDAACGHGTGENYTQDTACGVTSSQFHHEDTHCSIPLSDRDDRCGDQAPNEGQFSDASCNSSQDPAVVSDDSCASAASAGNAINEDGMCGVGATLTETGEADNDCNVTVDENTGFDDRCGTSWVEVTAHEDASCGKEKVGDIHHEDSHCGVMLGTSNGSDAHCGQSFYDQTLDPDQMFGP